MTRTRVSFASFIVSILFFIHLMPAMAVADDDSLEKLSGEYKKLYKKVLPAVVGISVNVKKAATRSGRAVQPRTLRPRTRQRSRSGVQFDAYGSGTVISEDGYILTSMEVVPENAESITVWFASGRKTKAEMVGFSRLNNVALIKANVRNLKFLQLGDSSKVKVGQRAMTFGSPFQATFIDGSTVFSVGVISGFYRAHDHGKYKGMAIETDALATGGSDGGPLVDSDGRIIGVVDLSYNYGKWHGLVVPINQVRLILDDMKKNMRVGPGLLGVKFKTSDNNEIVIKAVKDDSPADKAGLKAGDVILRFCGLEIDGFKELEKLLESLPPGTRFTAVIRRGSSEYIKTGVMARNAENVVKREIPEPVTKAKEPRRDSEHKSPGFFGVRISEKVSGNGALVENVMPGSSAATVGIVEGDRIVEFDGKKVGSASELAEVLGKCFAGEEYDVRIAREMDGKTWFSTLKVRLGESPKEFM